MYFPAAFLTLAASLALTTSALPTTLTARTDPSAHEVSLTFKGAAGAFYPFLAPRDNKVRKTYQTLSISSIKSNYGVDITKFCEFAPVKPGPVADKITLANPFDNEWQLGPPQQVFSVQCWKEGEEQAFPPAKDEMDARDEFKTNPIALFLHSSKSGRDRTAETLIFRPDEGYYKFDHKINTKDAIIGVTVTAGSGFDLSQQCQFDGNQGSPVIFKDFARPNYYILAGGQQLTSVRCKQ